MHPTLRTLGLVFAAAAGATMAALLVYAAVQQSYRTAADDPQIQIAADAAVALHAGAAPERLVPVTHVDLARGLAPWVLVVDASNRVLAASMSLDGNAPVPPPGVLDTARRLGEDRLTWMPRHDVRQAIVVRNVGDGRVVIAGRSLREVEVREQRLLVMTGMAWIAMLVAGLMFAGLAASTPAPRTARMA